MERLFPEVDGFSCIDFLHHLAVLKLRVAEVEIGILLKVEIGCFQRLAEGLLGLGEFAGLVRGSP